MENYTFEDMWLDLKNGYQIYYTYVKNRYFLKLPKIVILKNF